MPITSPLTAPMPPLRHVRITELVDRTARASAALGVLLAIAGIATAAGLVASQRQMAARYAILLATDSVASQTQAMRLSLGAWVLRGDTAAPAAWRHAASRARADLASIKASVASDGVEAALVQALGQTLEERINTATPVVATTQGTDQERAISEMARAVSEAQDSAVALAVDRLATHERQRLQHLKAREDLVLSGAGLVLVALGAWSVHVLRRNRRMTRTLLSSLQDAFAQTEQGRAELQAFNHATPLAVFHVDAVGTPRWLNAKADGWVGARRGPEAAAFIRDGIVADDRERVVHAWEHLVVHGERFEQVFRFWHETGEMVWAHAHAAPVTVEGVATGFVAVLQDITASRSLQDELARSRKRMRRMADAVPALIARIDDTETYRFVNATYREWFGDDAPQIGWTLRQFLGEDNYRLLSPVFARVRGGEHVRFEMSGVNLRGRQFVGDISYTPDHDTEGKFCGMYVMVNDISERKRLEESLFAAKELAQVTLESIVDAVLTTDRDGAVTFLNARAEALLELPTVTAKGQPVDTVVQLRDQHGLPSETSLLRAITEERVVDMPYPRKLYLSDGSHVDIEDVAAPIRDREGQVVGGVLVLRDVSVARAVAERMRQLAESDALTGLPNRMVFEQRLNAELAVLQPDETLAVLYMDLDGFKAVNDVHGHAAGDELLRQFANRLLSLTGASDTVCRLGGDEFVALLAPPVSLREAVVRAEVFIDAAATPFFWHGEVLSVTLSVGIAGAPRHGTDAHLLVREADDALYTAKEAGKNQWRVAGA